MRLAPLLVGGILILAVGAILARRTDHSPGQGTAGPTATTAAAQASPGADAPLVVPTPVIPLPRSCPTNSIPQVDNPARYGYCTPAGWGAYNNNNSNDSTQVIKPRPGGSPVLQPTEFDRIQIVVNLNTQSPGDSVPADCKGPPNDTIDGLATHHCTAPLNPNSNPYHATRAEFWQIELFEGKRFYMTAFVPPDATPEDDATIDLIAHNVKPPGSQ
jgi:hypothetical protein